MPLPKAPTKPAALLLSIPTTAAKPPKDVLLPTPARSAPDTAADRQSPSARLALVDTAADKAPVARTDAKPRGNGRKQRANGPSKLFVLDTNVLMHDPTSLFRFEEHDIYPADDDAGGTGQSQEGHVGSRTQCTSGFSVRWMTLVADTQ
jgi:PhoH-like ATPase